MWRIFRLGIKSSNCPGNQNHFRIIGTTCANAECDDKVDESNDLLNKENHGIEQCSGLASKAAKQHLNFLSQNDLSKAGAGLASKFKSSPISYQPNKLKEVDNSLKEIQWDQYVRQRTKVLSGSEKKKNSQNRSKASKKKEKSPKDKDLKSKVEDFSHLPFGALAEAETGRPSKFDKIPDDPEDLVDPQKEAYGERLSVNDYGRKMLLLCRERKLKEALEVLEVEMKAAGVPPDNYCYNVLINGCGKAGYTQKAFYLYRGMKQRGLKVEKFAYTGLFNSCANSPFKLTEGLELARRLRASLKEKEVPIHPITYHAMIKAFGHCGEIETAFKVADEMLEKQHVLTTDTMNFLLQACITDKESGFRHALMVWRKMRSLGITPCIYSYNLLLRCVKECQAGDPALLSQLLEAPAKERIPRKLIVNPRKVLKSPKEKDHLVVVEEERTRSSPATSSEMEQGFQSTQTTGASRSVSQISDNNEVVKVELAENMELEIVNESEERRTEPCDILPNVLSRRFRPGKVIGISSLETKEERLALLAGVLGVLSNMKEDDVKPNITTFTFFLESLPTTTEAEESLLSVMEAQKVVPDVIFCNKLIHRRGMRKQFDDAKEVLELMQKHDVRPDLVTFGCLALAASKVSQMRALLRDMEKSGFTPSEEIMGCLIKGSMAIREYAFTLELLLRMNSMEMMPSERTLNTLEEGRRKIKQNMVKQELESKNTPLTARESRKRDEMKLFIIEYKSWLKKSRVELDEHPWVQYGYKKTTTSVAKASV